MRRKEKRQFGMALERGAVIKDVPQRILYFGDQTLSDPATRLEEAREKLQRSMFRGLVESYALHVRELLDERERTTLELAMERAGAKWHAKAVRQIPNAAQSRRLQELDATLRAHAENLTPARLIDQLAACFCDPKPFLRLDAVDVVIDRMGIVADSAAAKDSAEQAALRRAHKSRPPSMGCGAGANRT